MEKIDCGVEMKVAHSALHISLSHQDGARATVMAPATVTCRDGAGTMTVCFAAASAR